MAALSEDARQALAKLTHYAIDKASPYPLALFNDCDTIEKIMDMNLVDLSIDGANKPILWTWINAHCAPIGKPVSPAVAAKCKTAGEVYQAVVKAAEA